MFMTWLTSIFVAMISGVAGLFLAGIVANACVSWYQISSREGQSGYFVILIAIGGGIAGVILGLITARVIASNYGSSLGRELLGSLGAVLIVSGAAALACRLLADIPPTLDGQELYLEVEFRMPDTFSADASPTAEGKWYFTFASVNGRVERKSSYGTIQDATTRYESGRWIVPAQVELFTGRGGRRVTLWKSDSTEVISFELPLPASPGSEFEQWSDWLPRQQGNGRPWPSDKMSCRFRVQKIPS
jgi:hypothetical protein